MKNRTFAIASLLLLTLGCGGSDETTSGAAMTSSTTSNTSGGSASNTTSNMSTACLSESDCGPDAFCSDAGTCESRECQDGVGCEEGQICEGFVCVTSSIVCEADQVVCQGRRFVRSCNPEGTEFEDAECDEGTACVDSEEGAACATIICDAGQLSCVDGLTRGVCDRTGTAVEAEACAEGNYCDTGSCLPQLCVPESTLCDGSVVLTCDTQGATQGVTVCNNEAICQENDAGCGCIEGACVTLACVPETSRCTEGGLVETCADDGSGYGEASECDAGRSCVVGACLPDNCFPTERICVGDVLTVCEDDGETRSTVNCGETGLICSGIGLGTECTERVCEPNTSRCEESSETLLLCDDRGSFENPTACPGQTHCQAGDCVANVCRPGEDLSCLDGNVHRCDARGSSLELVETCDADVTTCRAGACVPLECVPGEVSCVDYTLVICASNGLDSYAENCREQSSLCDAEVEGCVPWDCDPEAPTCPGSEQPDWSLEDFQPASDRYMMNYGLSAFRGEVTLVALLAGWCGYCRSQAQQMERMKLELEGEGYEVNVVAINDITAAEEGNQRSLIYILDDLGEVTLDENGDPVYRCTFPIFQDTAEVGAWTLHEGAKDDMYVYTSEGDLHAYLPRSGSLSTNLSTEEGYNNVKQSLIGAME